MLDEINMRREMMMKSAHKNGYTSKETIHYSQELDKLIYEYQCTFCNKTTKHKQLKNEVKQMMIWPIAALTSEIIYM
jgi:stage 0 sporulation regulatory protein